MQKSRSNGSLMFDGLDGKWRVALEGLPEGLQGKVDSFFKGLSDIRFFDPDGNPCREWDVYTGKTWGSALARAMKASDLADNSVKDVNVKLFSALIWKAALAHDYGIKPNWIDKEAKVRAITLSERINMDASKDAAWRVIPRMTAVYGAHMASFEATENAVAMQGGINEDNQEHLVFNISSSVSYYARYIAVSDIPVEEKERCGKYAEEMMDIIRKGYCCIGDISGRPQVLCKDSGAPY